MRSADLKLQGPGNTPMQPYRSGSFWILLAPILTALPSARYRQRLSTLRGLQQTEPTAPQNHFGVGWLVGQEEDRVLMFPHVSPELFLLDSKGHDSSLHP